MQKVLADSSRLSTIHNIISHTIQKIYPLYYPLEVVDFFLGHHSLENLTANLQEKECWLFYKNNTPIATGAIGGKHITGVFVLPHFQGQGVGGEVMTFLERKIAASHNKAVLDSSLAAAIFYEKRGYKTISHEKIRVNNGKLLIYEVMEKSLF